MRNYYAEELDLKAANSGMGFIPIAVAAPIIASGLMTVGTMIYGAINKRGARKVATTQIVNELEPYLIQNLAAWEQSNKTVGEQQYAIQNFDNVWAAVKQGCEDPAMGKPGQWCITDRQRNGKFDWFRRYRDPIANDPNVVPNPTTGEVIQSAFSDYLPNISVGGLSTGAVIALGLVAIGAISFIGSKS